MNQCLFITFSMDLPQDFLHTIIQKKARALHIEGLAQTITNNKVRIIACGPKEAIDDFVDLLHKEAAHKAIENIEIEPFLKDKDYRGVFRVIE